MADTTRKINDPVVENYALTAIVQFLNNLTPEQLAGIGFQRCSENDLICENIKNFEEVKISDVTPFFGNDENNEKSKFPNVIPSSEAEIQKSVFEILHSLGIASHLKGFAYLKDSIQLFIDKPGFIKRITLDLYPFIAEKYNSTPSRVERAMRHAIDLAYERNANMRKIFSHKPKNCEFIATIVEEYNSHLA